MTETAPPLQLYFLDTWYLIYVAFMLQWLTDNHWSGDALSLGSIAFIAMELYSYTTSSVWQ